jgi:hypothetical protein
VGFSFRGGSGETAFQEVNLKIKILTAVALLSVACVNAWANDDEARYNQRAAQTDMSLFREMDRAGKGLLTKDDVRGDMRLGTRFDDIDTNRDEVVTPQEMRTYIEKTYGVLPAPGQGSRSKDGAGLISLVPCPLSIDPSFPRHSITSPPEHSFPSSPPGAPRSRRTSA